MAGAAHAQCKGLAAWRVRKGLAGDLPAGDRARAAPLVAAATLRPYRSLTILRSTSPDHEVVTQALLSQLARAALRTRAGSSSVIVASGLSGAGRYLRADGDREGVDDALAFVCRTVGQPSWSVDSPQFADVTYDLVVVIRRNDLIAVHSSKGSLRDSLLRWLDTQPQLELVAPAVLNAAFLRGEAKGLWLRGTQSPTTLRPDSKQSTGRRLQDTLRPFEDSGYALSSARADLAGSPEQALHGDVGTTPRDSFVWCGPSTTFAEFIAWTSGVLRLIADITAAGAGIDRPYAYLSDPVSSLEGVAGAFEVVVASPQILPLGPETDEDLLRALTVMEHAILGVEAIPGSADFRLQVGYEGCTAGTLLCTVAENRGRFAFKIGTDPSRQATNPEATRELRDELRLASKHLSVYYDTGHVIDGRSIWRPEVRSGPFPNWRFEDFTGYDIGKEKPTGSEGEVLHAARDIHAAIAENGDDSLFAWVAARYQDGWLICDDGPGEAADFVHLAANGDLSLVHVKASTSRRRGGPSVAAYQEVVSQAIKNLGNLDRTRLHKHLSAASSTAPACWTNGQRVAGRSQFLTQLEQLRRGKSLLVVVQPHLSQATYRAIESSAADPARNTSTYRLRLLETLLNASRSAVAGLGADLHVISSLT